MRRSRVPQGPITPDLEIEHQEVNLETPEASVSSDQIRQEIAQIEARLAKLRAADAKAARSRQLRQEADARQAVAQSRRWPAKTPMPTHYVKHQAAPFPCRNPKCRRITLDTGQQAVICVSSGREFAWFRCKACGYAFEMPVKLI
jgi:hypothetical protein